MPDRCWAMCLAFNERPIIGYWTRHYASFCERVIVYLDADTDDGTGEAAEREGAEVRVHDTGGHLDDLAFVAFAQERYKEARGRAEWVVWVDADELLYHPRMVARLDELAAAGVTYPHTAGYTMLADAPPSPTARDRGQLYDLPGYRRGVPAAEYAKPCVFRPELEVAWSPGKHAAEVAPGAGEGAVAVQRDDGRDPLRLLHYRYFGERWLLERNARNYARIPEAARRAGLGREVYPEHTSGPYSPAWYRAQAAEAREVMG